jgi:hypothetical protein
MNITSLIPPFYIGQEVVVLEDYTHHLFSFKKGDEFKVTSISKNPCCSIWTVTVGIHINSYDSICTCRRTVRKEGEVLFAAYMFSPKIEIKEFISMKQLAEQQLEKVGVN